MNTESRREFEEWLATVKYDNSNILSPSNLAWEAWQAAREQVTEQLDQFENKLRIELRGHPDSKLWGDAGLIAATMRSVDAIDEVIDQRDRLAEACKKLMAIIGETNSLIDDYWVSEDEMDEAWNIADKALQSLTNPNEP